MAQGTLPFEADTAIAADVRLPGGTVPDRREDPRPVQPPSSREPEPLGAPAQHMAPPVAAAPQTSAPSAEPTFVRSRRARRYIVRVRQDGSVRVTIPARGSRREAAAFVERQREWIARQRKRLERERAERPGPAMSPDDERELMRRARRELPVRLLALASAFDLHVSRISIRNQRWRWGSCSRDGHISLNWRLVAMPDWVRDYVLIHELMHLKQMNHSHRFWKLVAAACPGFEAARAWLRANQRLLDERV